MTLEAELIRNGYMHLRQAPDGRWFGMQRFLFTWAILEDLGDEGYDRRWCYNDYASCFGAYCDFVNGGFVDKPAGWIVEKG